VSVELSIVIVNWNTRDLLAECLESVRWNLQTLECSYGTAGSPGVQTFVVDNASSDGSAGMVRARFPWVGLIENADNVGFARANNQALAQCRGRYVVLLNSDTIVPPASLMRLVTFADAHPRAGIVGPKLLNADGSFQAAFNDFPTPASLLLEAWGVHQKPRANPFYPSCPPQAAEVATQCDWVGGACLLARLVAIHEVGTLDQSFFMYSEEVDWCFRMKRRGWEVWFTPEVEIVHLGGGSATRHSPTQRLLLSGSKLRFVRKHYGRVPAQIAWLNFRLSSLAKAAGHLSVYLTSGNQGERIQARSHWHVAKELDLP
jgi:GT2 family glycosyltransferase